MAEVQGYKSHSSDKDLIQFLNLWMIFRKLEVDNIYFSFFRPIDILGSAFVEKIDNIDCHLFICSLFNHVAEKIALV